MKPIFYCGNVKQNILGFESKARQRILRLLAKLGDGLNLQPKDFKYMGSIGAGVYELRVRTEKQYRVFYVAKFAEAIYVLHAFIKKEQKTSQHDINIGSQWYKALITNRGAENVRKN